MSTEIDAVCGSHDAAGPKLCPYRKTNITEAYEKILNAQSAQSILGPRTDEFTLCLQDKCAMNRSIQAPVSGEMKWMNYCGLAGKP